MLKPILILILLAGVVVDGSNVTIVKKRTKAEMKRELIRLCPLMISEDLPFDYKMEYNEKLLVDVRFNLFRFIEIDDLAKT